MLRLVLCATLAAFCQVVDGDGGNLERIATDVNSAETVNAAEVGEPCKEMTRPAGFSGRSFPAFCELFIPHSSL